MLDAIDQAVDRAFAGGAEGQHAGFVQEFFELQVGAGADQFNIEAEGVVDGFAANETQHLQIAGNAFERKGNVGSVCVQHA
ncbi:hypothetical protein PS896_05773 [Pseudomonas fluorescens]|uniref:Uncharacterized protein n=1 Tax=Pseudomonas fluorescens TaxID=294 RepID=A0A5E7Q5R1_PSEFL|nr:hypothetical protein PS896_05773 [Pseudomonas fluorescens]